MARRVLVVRLRALGVVLAVDRRVPAAGRLPGRDRVGHVLGVGAPAEAVAVELVGDRLRGGRVHAALTEDDPVGPDRAGKHVAEGIAVGLGLGIGRLTAGQRDVVRETQVADPVVALQERPLGGQGASQVGRSGRRAEGLVVGLVLEQDHEDVIDRRRPGARRPACARTKPAPEYREQRRALGRDPQPTLRPAESAPSHGGLIAAVRRPVVNNRWTRRVGAQLRIRPRSASSSAICTALVAAPLRRLSPTIQRLRQRSRLGSRRIRPTSTWSWPAAAVASG